MLRRLLLVVLILLVAAAPALAAPATEANIDWRQAEGASIIVAMNLHMETDELDAQLAEFEELTGIRVNFQIYPEIGPLLPAMGYGDEQIRDLAATIDACDCDSVIIATPIDLTRVIDIKKPTVKVEYQLQEIGKPDLGMIIGDFLKKIK